MTFSNEDEETDYGLTAYLAIQNQLDQWSESSPAQQGRRRQIVNDAFDTPASSRRARQDDDDDVASNVNGEEVKANTALPPTSFDSPDFDTLDRIKGGVETPMPSKGENLTEEDDFVDPEAEEHAIVEYNYDPTFDCLDHGADSHQPYHDALLIFLKSRERNSLSRHDSGDDGNSMMQIDNGDLEFDEMAEIGTHDLKMADMKFFQSLRETCFYRRSTCQDDPVLIEACRSEGNFWDLLAALRSVGLSSLFYCLNGEAPPDLQLTKDPSTMVDISPEEVLQACLGDLVDTEGSFRWKRLNAALSWIQSCHARKWDDMLAKDYEGNIDPILPPPRRRQMWPSTLAVLKRSGKTQTAQIMHPDAPLQPIFGPRSSSPVDIKSSPLDPEDMIDDGRLLRACFMLFQAGRSGDAIQLVQDCGQPWIAVGWIGGQPLSSDGSGNPTRGLWKRQCRKIAQRMTQECHKIDSLDRKLYPSLAYEAAILSLLSDNLECALNNPVFETWEDVIHAILSAEKGIIEDGVLRLHNNARIEEVGENEGYFPYPGIDFDDNEDDRPVDNDGELGGALQKLESTSSKHVLEESGDLFHNGMFSFLVGHNAVKEYIEECAVIAFECESDYDGCFLRFVAHLVLYVDTVFPEFSLHLSLPSGLEFQSSNNNSLCELLLLQYIGYLSSMRNLWPNVPLYTSLLSHDNIIATFSDFLVHVHSDRERLMLLKQARELFPKSFDCQILRQVVRELILSDEEKWQREIGEDLPPTGVSPAEARMMRSIHWLCFYPEHRPDALICTNLLLRKFMLTCNHSDYSSKKYLFAAKVFIGKILPRNFIETASDGITVEPVTLDSLQNAQAEFLSIKHFLQAHTKYVHFIDVITKTSPCHTLEDNTVDRSSSYEAEIADKLERIAFRQKKVGLCKIVIDYATKFSDSLMEVLTFGGGWLVDQNMNASFDDRDGSDEDLERYKELERIRAAVIPMAVFVLHEALDKTAMWLQQVVFDTLEQFGSAAEDMLYTLFGTFDESGSNANADMLTASFAAPGYWHKKALLLASTVANDGHKLHEAFSDIEMQRFLKLMADSCVKFNEWSNPQFFTKY